MRFRGLLTLVFFMQASAAYSTSTMRCGNNIVELGDDQFRVIDICGQPDHISRRTKIIGSTLHHPRRTLDLQQYEEVEVEEWVYDFGRNRIRQQLRFENGILVEVKDLGRRRR